MTTKQTTTETTDDLETKEKGPLPTLRCVNQCAGRTYITARKGMVCTFVCTECGSRALPDALSRRLKKVLKLTPLDENEMAEDECAVWLAVQAFVLGGRWSAPHRYSPPLQNIFPNNNNNENNGSR